MSEPLKLRIKFTKRFDYGFKSGAITGLLVAGLALLAISIYYWALLSLKVDSRELINALIALGFCILTLFLLD